METFLTGLAWTLGIFGLYVIGMFVLTALVLGCGFYFVYRLCKEA